MRQQKSDPKEPEIGSAKHLKEFEKMVINSRRKKKKINNPIKELDTILATLSKTRSKEK